MNSQFKNIEVIVSWMGLNFESGVTMPTLQDFHASRVPCQKDFLFYYMKTQFHREAGVLRWRNAQGIVEFGGREVLVVNLPPLGCIPAMLTLFPDNSPDSHDARGCYKEINRITSNHNALLEESLVSLRAKYPGVKLYYGDLHGVYINMLTDPRSYSKALHS